MTWVTAASLGIILSGMIALSLHAVTLRSHGRERFKKAFGVDTWKCDTAKLRSSATTDEALATVDEDRPKRRTVSFNDASGVR